MSESVRVHVPAHTTTVSVCAYPKSITCTSINPLGVVVGQADSDVTLGQCMVSDMNLAISIIRHKTPSDDQVGVLSFPMATVRFVLLSHKSTAVPESASGPLRKGTFVS